MESIARLITQYTSHAAEIAAALIIGIALITLITRYILFNYLKRQQPQRIRTGFGSAVSLALELLLGADVLATAIAPSWNDIGQLAAIATIRTVLNYFLEKELKHENSR
jgi:uncharacterized membrane protein